MRLDNLHLVNFKSYTQADLDLRGSIHCLLGPNGGGKTNLLEAIHYLSLTRGFTGGTDADFVRHGTDHFHIRGKFSIGKGAKEVSVSYSQEKKKISEDGKDYSRFSEHVGKYPIVMVVPADIELVWDGGEVRRKFFDTLLSQLDRTYLEQLGIYQRHLRQRNSLLRLQPSAAMIDRELLAAYDEGLVRSATVIHARRAALVRDLAPKLVAHYQYLVDGETEPAGIAYSSQLNELDFGKELTKRLERDAAIGRTTVGIHRDDFLFTLRGHTLKSYGSQGQQKSFLIALKLCEFDQLTAQNGFKPLLLLDDIFDKLDDNRIVQLMKLISGGAFGQIFITDARPARSLESLEKARVEPQTLRVEGGSIWTG